MVPCSCGHENVQGVSRCASCDTWIGGHARAARRAPLQAPASQPRRAVRRATPPSDTGITGITSGVRKGRAAATAADDGDDALTLLHAEVIPDGETPGDPPTPSGPSSGARAKGRSGGGGDDSGPGTMLEPRCPACGTTTASSWRFCNSCGAPLGMEDHGTTPIAAAPAMVRKAQGRAAPARSGLRHELHRISGTELGIDAHVLRAGRNVIGRSHGDLVVPDDTTLSSRHAQFEVRGKRCWVTDLDSTNGTFIAIRGIEQLAPGDVILLGGRRILYRDGASGRRELVEMLPRNREGLRCTLRKERTIVGKEGADMGFPDDEFLSRRHAEVMRMGDGHALRDLSSTNKTFRLVVEARELHEGDRVVAGEQVLEYHLIK